MKVSDEGHAHFIAISMATMYVFDHNINESYGVAN